MALDLRRLHLRNGVSHRACRRTRFGSLRRELSKMRTRSLAHRSSGRPLGTVEGEVGENCGWAKLATEKRNPRIARFSSCKGFRRGTARPGVSAVCGGLTHDAVVLR